MTINPPNPKTKWWYRGAFIIMGLSFIALSTWQFDRADKENKRLSYERQQEQVRSEGNTKYMQGQLDSMSKMLGTLATNSTPAQIVAAVKGVLPRGAKVEPIKADELRVVQENIPSSHDDAPFGIKVTIQPDKEIAQVTFELTCDSTIAYAEINAGMQAIQSSSQGPMGNKVRFLVVFPTLSPAQPYTVIISAKQAIRVVGVKRIY